MNDFEYFSKKWEQLNESFGIKKVTVYDVQDSLSMLRSGEYVKPIRTPLKSLWPCFNFGYGRLTLWTGYPQSGKSELLRFLAFHFGLNQETKVAVFSPESDTVIFLDELTKLAGNFVDNPDQYINDNWTVLDIQDGMPSMDDIIKVMSEMVDTGHRFFIIDPMNWITSSNYTASSFESLRLSLTQLKQFAKRTDTCINYVEHPKTPQMNKDGGYPKANAFMVNGGVMHWNKVDAVVILHRNREVEEFGAISSGGDTVDIEIAKQKIQRIFGYPATVRVRYDQRTFSYKDETW